MAGQVVSDGKPVSSGPSGIRKWRPDPHQLPITRLSAFEEMCCTTDSSHFARAYAPAD